MFPEKYKKPFKLYVQTRGVTSDQIKDEVMCINPLHCIINPIITSSRLLQKKKGPQISETNSFSTMALSLKNKVDNKAC